MCRHQELVQELDGRRLHWR